MSVSSATTARRHVYVPRVGWRQAVAQLVPAAVLVWLTMCVIGYVLARPLSHVGFTDWEAGADRYFASHRVSGLNTLTNLASLAGDTPAIIAVASISFLALRLLTRRWKYSLTVLATMLGEVVIFWFTTIVIARSRPTVPHLDGSPPTSSFPSGHTAASTSLYGLLAIIIAAHLAQARWRILAYTAVTLLVVTIGVSRIYRGMHYPTDVLGGMVLGALWLTATTHVLLRQPHDA